VSLLGFLSPLPKSIWAWFIVSLLVGNVFLFATDILTNKIEFQLKVYSSEFLNSFSTFYKLIVEQEGKIKLKILLVYSFTIMLVSSLYKNEISSGLIVPQITQPLHDLIDVVYRNGYKLLLPTKKYNDVPDDISELAYPCRLYFEKKNASALFDITRYQMRSKKITLYESLLVATYEDHALLHDLNRKEYEILQMLLQYWRPNYVCQLAREPVDTFSHFVKFSNFQHPKMMKLMELFRKSGLLEFWKHCWYYIARSHMLRYLKTRKNGIITPKTENLYLSMSEINSLFVFLVVLSLVATFVFVKERRGELHLKIFRCKVLISVSCTGEE